MLQLLRMHEVLRVGCGERFSGLAAARRTRVISSSNFSPYMLSPPRPVPVGSPPCENSEQTRSGQKTQPHAGCWRHKLTAWARLNHEVFDYAVEAGSGGAEARQRNENAESRADVRE